MKTLIALLALSTAVPALAAATVASPDGRTVVTLDTDGDGRPLWSVARDGKPLMDAGRLGFILADQPKLERGFAIAGEAKRSHDSRWEQPWGERRFVRDHYNELTVTLAEKAGLKRRFDVVVRVHDDGLGLRYVLPASPTGQWRIQSELTEFAVAAPERATAWWIPAMQWNREEYLYRETPLREVGIAQTPITLRTGAGQWLAIHEAALVDYSAINVQNDLGTLRAALTPAATGPAVVRDGAFATPWRSVHIADAAPGLANSSLTLNLNEPNRLGDVSWAKPCKFAGIWWGMFTGKYSWNAGPKHGATTANALQMIDWAAENRICGLLIEGWNDNWDDWFGNGWNFSFTKPYPDFDLPRIAAYARKKGVRLVGHHETAGNIAHYEANMAAGFDLYQRHGIDMVKTGYVADAGGIQAAAATKGIGTDGQPHDIAYEWHEGQAMARHHVKVVTEAAKRRIGIDAHEPIKDTGLRRTYPNMMSREGARGMEYNAFGAPKNGPEHEATLAFTRLLAGPMDYTPGIVSLEGVPGSPIDSTLAKQLALYVTIYSPVVMAADLPENYAKQAQALRFIRDVPVDWEESVTLAGEPARFVVTARQRRGGGDWWLGAAGGAKTVAQTVKLAFLKPGTRYRMTLWRDGDDAATRPASLAVETRTVTATDTLALKLAPGGGGAAARFEPLR